MILYYGMTLSPIGIVRRKGNSEVILCATAEDERFERAMNAEYGIFRDAGTGRSLYSGT